jgi:hypothetical protein
MLLKLVVSQAEEQHGSCIVSRKMLGGFTRDLEAPFPVCALFSF